MLNKTVQRTTVYLHAQADKLMLQHSKMNLSNEKILKQTTISFNAEKYCLNKICNKLYINC